jgi:serine protease AprX
MPTMRARPVPVHPGPLLMGLLLFCSCALAQALPPPDPIVVPGHGVVAWALGLVGVPQILYSHGGVSVTWTETNPDGTLHQRTLASADGTAYSPAIEFDPRLMLRSGAFDPLLDPEPDVPSLLTAGDDTNVYIVQFTGSLIPGMLADLARAGATPRAFLPNFAYITTIPADALAAVRAMAGVRAVVPYHPAYRLDDAVRARLFNGRKNDLPPDDPIQYNIQALVPGPSLKSALVDAIQGAGGTTDAVSVAGALIRATLTRDQLRQVLRADGVLFIDPAGPPQQDMDIIRGIVGADFIQNTLGFTGQGVRAMVVDDNLRTTHLALRSPPALLFTPASGDLNHGTSCYGIIFGNGTAYAPARGLMPSAQQGYFADYDFMPDRVALAVAAGNDPYRCVLQSNSWGHPWTFGYTTDSAEMDLAAFATSMLIVQSQSNSGNQWSRPEAWAKNVLSVGGIVHWNTPDTGDDCYCGLASVGPAADGRVKPDLALHNDQISTVSGSWDQGYTTNFGGTSAAAAGVAGVAGLVYQMWHEGVFAGFGRGSDVFADRPAAATVRAMLINTAFRYDFAGGVSDMTRFRQGWGVPRLDRLYKARQGMFILDQSIPLQVGQAADFLYTVPPGARELDATMAYRDVPGTTSALLHRVNDVTLVATSPGGITYWGNAGLVDGNVSIPGGGPDNKNVVENVLIPDPEPGTWTITVYASEVNADSRPETPELDADFSLVVASRVETRCAGDWNRDQVVNSTDVSDFVNDWFTDLVEGTSRTDVDRNGVVNSTDVSGFINSFFDDLATGCG